MAAAPAAYTFRSADGRRDAGLRPRIGTFTYRKSLGGCDDGCDGRAGGVIHGFRTERAARSAKGVGCWNASAAKAFDPHDLSGFWNLTKTGLPAGVLKQIGSSPGCVTGGVTWIGVSGAFGVLRPS